uniref:Uncharacterized protein n=1 Tax=Onchocerca volvulus TaxID=6282 RepID=A0A8R1U1B5_ONCVO
MKKKTMVGQIEERQKKIDSENSSLFSKNANLKNKILGGQSFSKKRTAKFSSLNSLQFDLSFKDNSNNLATIDIPSGFAGMETYQPVIIVIQIIVTTYSGPLLIVFGWWQYSVDKSVTSVSLSQKRNALLFWISFVLQLNIGSYRKLTARRNFTDSRKKLYFGEIWGIKQFNVNRNVKCSAEKIAKSFRNENMQAACVVKQWPYLEKENKKLEIISCDEMRTNLDDSTRIKTDNVLSMFLSDCDKIIGIYSAFQFSQKIVFLTNEQFKCLKLCFTSE